MSALDQYKQVLSDTLSSKPTLVDYWARRAIISEALMGSSYLKRKIQDLWSDRKNDEKRDKIKMALYYLKQLRPICDESNLGHMIPGLFDKHDSERTDGLLTVYSKEMI